MKYNIKAKVFGFAMSKLLTSYCSKHDIGVNIKDYIKPIQKEYKEMIERTPGLAKGNTMQDNLTGASYFFAMAKVIPTMTPDLMNDMVNECMYSDMMVNMHKTEREKGVMFSDKVQDKMVQQAKVSQNSTDEMDWIFTYEKHLDEFYITYTKCGICRLAEREGMQDYLPCMCKMDYPKYDIKGAKLIRTKTLANGDDCCNFHVCRKK